MHWGLFRYLSLRGSMERNRGKANHVSRDIADGKQGHRRLIREGKMATMTVDPECPHVVRRVRRLIRDRMGTDAATVFGEAMANVREHGKHARAELVLHNAGFAVRNVQNGAFREQSRKPTGEGGYGRQIMERCGATMDVHCRHCHVIWRRPQSR